MADEEWDVERMGLKMKWKPSNDLERPKPGEVMLPTSNWMAYDLPWFNMRNGDPSTAEPMIIRAFLPREFHWVPIDGLDPQDARKCVDGYIKSALSQLNVSDPARRSEALKRKLAIMLGTIRAVTTANYRITTADLIPGEVAAPRLVASTDENGVVSYHKILEVGEDSALDTPLNLTETEKAVVGGIVTYGIGVAPLQGYSLIMTCHDYLSNPGGPSRRAFQVVEKAFWKGQAVKEWYEEYEAEIRDAAWHKSCLPLQMSIKTELARDVRIKDMLMTAGAGACASSLPAKEEELRTADNYLTVIRKVAPLVASYGSSIGYSKLESAVAFVTAFPGGKNPTGPLPTAADEEQKKVKTRREALYYLKDILMRSKAVAAFCYGFHVGMSASSTTADTLKGKNALSKLRYESPGNYMAGLESYKDFAAFRNAMRTRGDI